MALRCSLQMREAAATAAVVSARLANAAQELKAAAEELEHAFEPAHRTLKDKFGTELREEFFDSAGEEVLHTLASCWFCRSEYLIPV